MAWQTAEFPLVAAYDQFTDSRRSQKLSKLVNFEWSKTGVVTKRSGTVALATTALPCSWSSATTLAHASKVLDRYAYAPYGGAQNQEICAIVGSTPTAAAAPGNLLYTYGSAANTWLCRDQAPEATMSSSPIAQGESSTYSGDVGYGSHYIVYAWQTSISTFGIGVAGDIYVTIADDSSGAVVVANLRVNTTNLCMSPRIVMVGNIATIYYVTTMYRVCYVQYNLSTLTPGSEVLLGTISGSSWPIFDVIAGAGNTSIIAYQTTTSHIQVTLLTSAMAVAWSVSVPVSTSLALAVGLAFDPIASVVYVGYGGSTSAINGFKLLFGSGAVSVADTVIFAAAFAPTRNVGIVMVGSNVMWTASAAWSATAGGTVAILTNSSLVVSPTVPITRVAGCSPQCRPFVPISGSASGTAYVVVKLDSYLQGTYFLVDLRAQEGSLTTGVARGARLVATAMPRRALGADGRNFGTLANVLTVDGKTYQTVSSAATDASWVGRFTVCSLEMNFFDSRQYQTAEALSDVVISGGSPSLYDGNVVQEIGFSQFPEGVALVNSGLGNLNQSGSGNVQYGYQIVFEYVDANGNRQRSAPSVATYVTVTPNSAVVITAPYLALTNKQKPYATTGTVGVIVYRTLAGGTTFYKVTADDLPATNVNDPSNALTSITDTVADSTIATNQLLYTTDGTLPNFCPPSATLVVQHKGRVWLSGTDDARMVWYSQPLQFGLAPSFNDALTIRIDEGGPITAIASLDDKLVVFKYDRIFVIYGDGPATNGVGSDYLVQRVAGDVGCIEPRSIVLGPDGLFFQSARGIEILGRDLSIGQGLPGRDVKDELVTFPTIVSASLHAPKNQIRFEVSNGTIGECLVYDYLRKTWSTFSYYDGVTAGVAATSAIVYQGFYLRLSVNAVLAQETNGLGPYSDVGTATAANWITSSWTISDLSLTQSITGYARARSVTAQGERLDPHDVNITVTTDHGSAAAPWTVNYPCSEVTMAQPFDEALQLVLQVQKVESITITVADTWPNASQGGGLVTWQGANWHGLAVVYRGKERQKPPTRDGVTRQ